jgi:hypothetical protein
VSKNKVVFLAAVVLLIVWQYYRYKGTATVGPLLDPNAILPPDEAANPLTGGRPSGMTEQEEWNAINRYR